MFKISHRFKICIPEPPTGQIYIYITFKNVTLKNVKHTLRIHLVGDHDIEGYTCRLISRTTRSLELTLCATKLFKWKWGLRVHRTGQLRLGQAPLSATAWRHQRFWKTNQENLQITLNIFLFSEKYWNVTSDFLEYYLNIIVSVCVQNFTNNPELYSTWPGQVFHVNLQPTWSTL